MTSLEAREYIEYLKENPTGTVTRWLSGVDDKYICLACLSYDHSRCKVGFCDCICKGDEDYDGVPL